MTTGERELTDAECHAIRAWVRAGFAKGQGDSYYFALIRAGWQAAIAAQPAQPSREPATWPRLCGCTCPFLDLGGPHVKTCKLAAAQPERARDAAPKCSDGWACTMPDDCPRKGYCISDAPVAAPVALPDGDTR